MEEAADKSRVPALKLLLDQGLARSTAVRLRSIGMDVVHVAEIGMERASDGEILVRGREEGRVIVTRDADFHAAMARSRTSMPSVVRVRIEGLRAERMTDLLVGVLTRFEADLASGAMVSITAKGARLRRLPLAKS